MPSMQLEFESESESTTGEWQDLETSCESKPSAKTQRLELLNQLAEKHGLKKTGRDRMQHNETTIARPEPSALQKLPPTEIDETQLVSSEELSKTLDAAGLRSMTLLKQSADRLMKLMESSVSDSDMERARDGAQDVPLHKVEIAMKCANTLATTVQTQINMLKAIKGKK